MLDLSRPGSNHLVLGALAGRWAFQDAQRAFVKGVVVRKTIYDGRFYTVEITGGRLQVPVADGKMKEDNYRGWQLGAKTLTYLWESELIRGDKKNNKRVLTIVDGDDYKEEYYEEQGGRFKKVRELVYKRLAEDDTVQDKEAIRQLVLNYENAWNRHDARGLADNYDTNATWVNWFGAYYIGRG